MTCFKGLVAVALPTVHGAAFAGHGSRHAGVSHTAPAGKDGPALACRPAHCVAQKRSATRTGEPSRGRSCLLCAQAVSACRQAWGERCLSELDAEDRLATACEKAPTSDPATAALRAAFQVQPSPVHTLGLCQCHAM